jgi:hypothetical protein
MGQSYEKNMEQRAFSKKKRNFAVEYDIYRQYLLVWSDSSRLYCDVLGVFHHQGNTQLWHSEGA